MSPRKFQKARRSFLRTTGRIGAGALLASVSSAAGASAQEDAQTSPVEMIPTRSYGKTGEKVSILSLGGVLNESDLLVFRQAFQLGVRYWDTAEGYKWGNNEKAIGKYFSRFPEDRKKIFLVTKGGSSDPAELTEKLDQSLQRMNTSYVDLYFIHHVSDAKEELTRDVRRWAEKEKSAGRIRHFGFSTHKNMEETMTVASGLGWIDGIMMSYNYRLMVKDEMKRAVEKCAAAGIGLTAMKTQASFTANFYSSIGSETDAALGMTETLMKKGFTAEQAKLRAVWENPAISSICSAMPNMTILQANAAAALNRKTLSRADLSMLQQFAQETSGGYCAGCARICESAIGFAVPICDLFRYAMYKNSYGDREQAVSLFHRLPEKIRRRIMTTDYSRAEKACPQGIAIGTVLREEYHSFTGV